MARKVITGAIHIHTTDSDGTKSHEEIAAIASQAGLDFILFNDHMTLQGLYEGKEGFYKNVLAIVGYEHNDKDDCNHLLIYDIDRVFPATMEAAEYVTAAANHKALSILAHPDEIRGRDARFRSYPWTDWTVSGFDGLEIWNHMSEWMEHLKFYNRLRMIFSPRKCLLQPTKRILRKWDELAQDRKIVGIGSVDAHGFLYRAGPLRLTIFPYKVQFKSIRTHLILDEPLAQDFPIARGQVLEAIRNCRAFVSNYRWGDAGKFSFTIDSKGQEAVCGDEIVFEPGLTARINLPLKGRIRLIGNGLPVKEHSGRSMEAEIEKPGIYRVEVFRGRRGWIFSNHIYIRDKS